MFVSRLAGRAVFNPYGDRLGKLRDFVAVERWNNPPRVVGLVVEIPGRKRVFIPISQVTSIANGEVICTGQLDVRKFEQRAAEQRVLAEFVGRVRKVKETGIQVRIEDAAIEKTRSGEWNVTAVFVKPVKPALSALVRNQAKLLAWEQLQHNTGEKTATSAELLIQTLIDLKPADLAESLLELTPERRMEVVRELSDDLVADALEEMSDSDQMEILGQLKLDRAADVLDHMEPDDAADLIGALPEQDGAKLLDLMEPEEAEDVRRLLAYEQDTAGGLMNPAPIVLPAEASVAEALAMIRNSEIAPAMAAAVYVTLPPYETPTGEYQGLVHFQRMLRFAPHEKLSALIDPVEPVLVDAPAAVVARRLASYDLVAVPIVDHDNNLLGVATIDDVLDHLLPDDWRSADDESEKAVD